MYIFYRIFWKYWIKCCGLNLCNTFWHFVLVYYCTAGSVLLCNVSLLMTYVIMFFTVTCFWPNWMCGPSRAVQKGNIFRCLDNIGFNETSHIKTLPVPLVSVVTIYSCLYSWNVWAVQKVSDKTAAQSQTIKFYRALKKKNYNKCSSWKIR